MTANPPNCALCRSNEHVAPCESWPEWFHAPAGTVLVWICSGCYTILGAEASRPPT